MATLEYMLENYVVNTMFSYVFPSLGSGDPFKTYMYLIARFGMIRTLLIGMSEDDGFGSETVERVVSAFSRKIEHSKGMEELMVTKLEKEGKTDLAHVALLLRLP